MKTRKSRPKRLAGDSVGRNQLAGIELLRFVCGLAVVIFHYPFFFAASAVHPMPLQAILAPIYEHGDRAVHVFWTVSGFIFFYHYAQTIREGGIGFIEFFTRRFSRLYPLHFISLILVVVGQFIYHAHHVRSLMYGTTPEMFGFNLLLASNWFEWQQYSFNGPIWSVSAEILVYAAFFFVARKIVPNRFVTLAIVALTTMTAVLVKRSNIESFISHTVFECAAFFFAGGFAQGLVGYRYVTRIAAAFAFLALVAVTMGFTTFNGGVSLIVAVGTVSTFAKLGRVAKPLSFLGNATYSLYLLHFPLALFIVIGTDALGFSREIFLNPASLVVYVVAVFASALPTFKYFERPAQEWLRQIHIPEPSDRSAR